MVSRTLPLGQRESLEYDEEGNQTARVTFEGDRLEYDFDSNGRMIRKRVPGYSEYSLTYTKTGQRESVLDYRGLTTYEYDNRDRLVRVDYPEGTFVSYTWDAAGNRASVTSPSQTVDYGYDAANRMMSVLEPGGGLFTYSYDSAGNQTGLSFPNGVVETRTYDVLNRLLAIDAVGPTGSVASFRYSLDATGRTIAAAEHDSRSVALEYDDKSRLTQEAVVGSPNADYLHQYVYDSVGNRQLRATQDSAELLSYDENDRMTAIASEPIDWSEDGSQLTSLDGRDVYRWDAEGRLLSVERASSTFRYEYDIDGIRIRLWRDNVAVDVVVDPASRYAQVIEQHFGGVTASFVRGVQLLGKRTPSEVRYVHLDAMGSTRSGCRA